LVKRMVRFVVVLGVVWIAPRGLCVEKTNDTASAIEVIRGWKEVPFKYEVQHPYDLDLKERYKFDAATGTHDFWVFFTDKPHAPPPNKTTARTEMRLETFSAGEHMFDADVNVQPGTFACIGQVFDEENGPVTMLISHPDGKVTAGNNVLIQTNAIGNWWNLKMSNDSAEGGKIRIYVDNVLKGTFNSRGPRAYYFKCGVYSRKNSGRSEALFRNIKMWVKGSGEKTTENSGFTPGDGGSKLTADRKETK